MKVNRQGYPAGFEQTLRDMQNMHVEIGFFPEAHYPDGKPVAYIATIQEFGYPEGGIPARPFFRPTITQNKTEYGQQFAGAMAGTLAGKIPSFASALEQIGGLAAGDISKAISRVTNPPLAQATIDRKGSSKPLVDSGLMIQSVTYKVDKK